MARTVSIRTPTSRMGETVKKLRTLERLREVAAPFKGPPRFGLDEPESVFGQWLREFGDDRQGGSSPPPMH